MTNRTPSATSSASFYRRPKTKLGYDLSSVVSALQKDVRRGVVYGATWWTKELIRSGFGAYLWRRLLVIASEDVGPAAPHIPALVAGLHSNAIALTRKRTPTGADWRLGELQAIHAAIAMCLAPKSRIVAEVCLVAEHHALTGNLLPVPEYALDCHTDEGRRRGVRKATRAAIDHWQQHGRLIHPDAPIADDRWKDELDRIWADPANVGLGFVSKTDNDDEEEGR